MRHRAWDSSMELGMGIEPVNWGVLNVANSAIARFLCSLQLSSPFFVSSRARLLGEKTDVTRSEKLPILRKILAARSLEGKKPISIRWQSESTRQTSESFGEARGSQMPSLRQHQSLERCQVPYKERRSFAAIPLQRLLPSVCRAIDNSLPPSFSPFYPEAFF